MSYHNILSKSDRALAAYLKASVPASAALIFPAKQSTDKPLPICIVFSDRAAHLGAGNYEVKTAVMVKTPVSVDVDEATGEPKATSEALVASLFDACFASGVSATGDQGDDTPLADAITAAARASTDPADADLADFTCQNITVESVEAGHDRNGPAWLDTLNLELVVAPSNVS